MACESRAGFAVLNGLINYLLFVYIRDNHQFDNLKIIDIFSINPINLINYG